MDGWEKKASKFLQNPSSGAPNPVTQTHVQFHQDQIHVLVAHESQIAIYEALLIKMWDVHIIALQGNNGISEHTWSANKKLLEIDSAMTAMEVDSEQTFGKTTHENAKTSTMQDELDESLGFSYGSHRVEFENAYCGVNPKGELDESAGYVLSRCIFVV
nr:topless-related protein 4 isoform X2 [Ipomoea batatas]GMD78461.1 topless-related protein 4 isoform X2 [Ipomoea batatas]